MVTNTEDTEMRHRFKVVKLVSSQPYTRGRWTCFDYNDENQNTINISKHVPANKITPNEQLEQSVLLQDQNCQTGTVSGGQMNPDQSEVAIDNKIEQAMDLVKSHLMFAVREEVDVLKERIKELESDIQILKAHATPETLALLTIMSNVNVNSD
ncbi:tsc22 domain containing protein [Dermatophagoides farinae]|uniref:Tsc22 domain containing protein n=1 Tax=Dermatophagoides farinae TaxID=6954 RepID=A0A9D4NQV1_DERFA|nr:tsc22 domain containing protein [Dermatophagoides farinae]